MIITKYKLKIDNMIIDFLSMEEAESYQSHSGGTITVVDEEYPEPEEIVEDNI